MLTGTGDSYRLLLRNGVLTHTSAPQLTPADAVVHLPAAALPGLALGGIPEDPGAGVRIEGDASVLPRLLPAPPSRVTGTSLRTNRVRKYLAAPVS